MMLFVDATLQQEKESRTYEICQSYLNRWQEVYPEDIIRHLVLSEEELRPVGLEDIKEREALVRAGNFDHEALRYANEFAKADHIVIGAPYWELSFPAALKLYIERVSVCGVAFEYTEHGPRGLCKALGLTYITSAGGYLDKYNLGTEYVAGMCEGLWGIPKFQTIAAQGLDIEGVNVQEIVRNACNAAASLVN